MTKFMVEITIETENGVPDLVVERTVETETRLEAALIAITEFYGRKILKLRVKKC